MSASVPDAEPERGLVLDLEVERLEPPARARPAEPDVDRRGRDVEVLRVRQVDEEAEDREHVEPDEDALAAPRCRRRRRRALESAFETGDQPAGHSLSPSAICDACQRSSVVTISAIRPRIRSASPRWLPSNRAGRCTLRIRNADDDADEHEHAEHVDEEDEPALVPEPRERPVARRPRRGAPSRSSGSRTTKPQKMNAWTRPGTSRWRSFRWPSTTVASSCARRPSVARAVGRLARAGRCR